MTGPTSGSRSRLFRAVAFLVTLIIAGVVSYLASPAPDGLDSASRQGCQVIDRGGDETLTGQCIARSATEHPMANSPLADYSLGGSDGTVGPAGVIGVLVTLAAAGVVFRVIARSKPRRGTRATPGD